MILPALLIELVNYSFSNLFSSTVISCTRLSVNPKDPLRISICDNLYGSKCNFSCPIGYRLNGSSAVTCVASDNQQYGMWNNAIPKCEGRLEKFKSECL